MRAFYLTVRPSNEIPDVQVAYEIGQPSAGKTLAFLYGGVPPHWLADDGPNMKWLPDNGKPAWEAISSIAKTPQCPAQNIYAVGGVQSEARALGLAWRWDAVEEVGDPGITCH